MIADRIHADDSPQLKEFQVVIKNNNPIDPLILRFTYPNKNSGTIISVEELDSLERIKCSCKFKGRSYEGDGCYWLVDIKKGYAGIKPNDWMIHNPEMFVDSYHRIH